MLLINRLLRGKGFFIIIIGKRKGAARIKYLLKSRMFELLRLKKENHSHVPAWYLNSYGKK